MIYEYIMDDATCAWTSAKYDYLTQQGPPWPSALPAGPVAGPRGEGWVGPE